MKALVKYLIVVLILLAFVLEVGLPLLTRSDAAGAAQDAASAAALNYFGDSNLSSARAAATSAAAVRGATVTNVVVQPNGDVTVTVTKETSSPLLVHISALKNWYDVKASATASPAQD